MPAPAAIRSAILLAACLMLPGAAAAQSAPPLLESYGRVATLLNYMSVYVAESLLACAEKNVLTEEQTEVRYAAYRKRNAALLERAETWSQQAEKRLQAQGEERAAQRVAEEAGLSAMAAASARAQAMIGKAGDARAACAEILAAIEAGRYDLSGNAEFVDLLKVNP
ncbi:MAG: hypothetical protein WAO95_00205 [Burkholderiales bacterium]